MHARVPVSSDISQLRKLMAERKANDSEKPEPASSAAGKGIPPSRYRRPTYRSTYHHNRWSQQQEQQEQGVSSVYYSRRPYHNTTHIEKATAMKVIDLQAGDPVPEKEESWHPHQQSPECQKPKPGEERKLVIILWAKTVIAYMVCIFAILSLYWAASLRAPDKLHALAVHVVDFDGQAPYSNVTAFVGPMMTNLTREIHAASPPRSLGYRIMPASEYGHDPLIVRHAVRNGSCWAAVVINSGATALLLDAASTGNASYDPTGAVQYFVHTAREETVTYRYILPELETLTAQFQARFGPFLAQMLLTNDSFSPAVMARASAAMNPGVSPVTINLRSSEPATATTTVTTGMMFLFMIAIITFPFFLPLYNKCTQSRDDRSCRSRSAIARRWAATLMVYFCASLAYSLVPLVFGVPFGRASGAFPAFWMVSFAGIAALGLLNESMIMALGEGRRWALVWLLFWTTANAVSVLNALELAPAFLSGTLALPLYQAASAFRRILFDLGDSGSGDIGNEIGFCFATLFSWILLGSALFPVGFNCMRRRTRYERVPGNRLAEERYAGSTSTTAATADATADAC